MSARSPGIAPWAFLLGLLLTGASTWADGPRRATMTFESPAVGRTMAYDVLLPAAYEASRKRYPVLYLLHGIRSHHRGWSFLRQLAEHPAWPRDLIVVLPDAGNTWYVNWTASTDAHNAWEDYIVADLIAHVDRHLRTIPGRAGRAISGFSMGGYGALTLGLRHPRTFVSAGSISGYLGYARAARQALEGRWRSPERRRARPSTLETALQDALSAPDRAIASKAFRSQAERTPEGHPFASGDIARAHDPFHLVTSLARRDLPHLHLACGTEDHLFGFTSEMVDTLLAARLPFAYWQHPGRHDHDFLSRALLRIVPAQYEEMTRALGMDGSDLASQPGGSTEETR